MSAEAITTVVKMMETLPDNAQSQTESNLIQQARLAKQQITKGKAQLCL